MKTNWCTKSVEIEELQRVFGDVEFGSALARASTRASHALVVAFV